MIVLTGEDFRRQADPVLRAIVDAQHGTHMMPSREESIAACERAEKMLLHLLKPKQRRQYRKSKSFTVKAASGRKYGSFRRGS